MRAGIALALIALAFSIGSYSTPAVAQHHATKQKAQKPKTDAELIASAMSAAPLAVSNDATVVAVGSDGKLRTLRQGQGAFTILKDLTGACQNSFRVPFVTWRVLLRDIAAPPVAQWSRAAS